MIKKKAKSKTAKKVSTKKSSAKSKKETNPAEVRKEISKMVEAEAAKMTEAVIGEGKKGQLATVKYLFEVANIFPPAADGTQATEEEDCLAKMLLDRMKGPAKAASADEENETSDPVTTKCEGEEASAEGEATKDEGMPSGCGVEAGS